MCRDKARGVGSRSRRFAFALVVAASGCKSSTGTNEKLTSGAEAGPAKLEDATLPADGRVPPDMTGIPDCSSKYAPKPELDNAPMCRIVGDRFASALPHANHEGTTPVKVSSFYLDQYEVTVEQFARFLTFKGDYGGWCEGFAWMPETRPVCLRLKRQFEPRLGDEKIVQKGKSFHALPKWARFPIAPVAWDAARQYCEWVGKRLPTAAEWEYAAGHDPTTGEDRQYPWGNIDEPSRRVCDLPGCIQPQDAFGLAPIGLADGTKGRGDGRTIFGAHDMAGNVDELTSDCVGELTCSPCIDPKIDKCTYDAHIAQWGSPISRMGRTDSAGFRCAYRFR